MQFELSNQVIARIDDEVRPLPRRTLDLGNIFTPELGVLSPQRTEIAPRGRARDAALIAYSERLRESYRSNEGGIRDGMVKLGQAFQDGQTIAISCFCRAGEICHADVVKTAIEKVGETMKARGNVVHRSHEVVQEQSPAPNPMNPRTQRAINEILSATRSDLILSRLEDTEGRNRSEHASHLNGHSQFLRDLYERGAVVRDGVLITPREIPSSSAPLTVASVEYAIKKLEPILNESRAKELAPRIVDLGARIAGDNADRDTKIKVFNWIYGALEGRKEFLQRDDSSPVNETKAERFDRTLNEIANLSEEMARLEPSDRSALTETLTEREGVERDKDEDLSLDKVYEDAISQEGQIQDAEPDYSVGEIQDFERVELGSTHLSQRVVHMSQEELDKWINVRLPILDELLENGMPVDSILKPYHNDIYYAAKENPSGKQAAVDDLRFASAYIEHQLKHPESRLRHFNPRYRNYAAMLESATSRSEVIDAASKIRLENARLGFEWDRMADAQKAGTPHPLTSKEMQYLFTEVSPRHYTSEMTAVRLSYSNAGDAARTKTDALIRAEISPSREAQQLIDGLEARMERRRMSDALSATRHFLQSLKTPNDEMRYKNPFDYREVYQKLPPAERDFVYQRAVHQKESLESRLVDASMDRPTARPENVPGETKERISTFREALKADIAGALENSPHMSPRELKERTSSMILINLEKAGSKDLDQIHTLVMGRELGEQIAKRRPHEIERSVVPNRSETLTHVR